MKTRCLNCGIEFNDFEPPDVYGFCSVRCEAEMNECCVQRDGRFQQEGVDVKKFFIVLLVAVILLSWSVVLHSVLSCVG
jgi:hypothetical protein